MSQKPISPDVRRRRPRMSASDWEDEEQVDLDTSERGSSSSKRPITPVRKVGSRNRSARGSPTVAKVTPRNIKAPRTPQATTERARASAPARPTKPAKSPPSSLSLVISTLFNLLLGVIRLFNAILAPFHLYIFLTFLFLLAVSGTFYLLLNTLPAYLAGSFGKLLQPSIGHDTLLLPLRTFSTPVCAISGQLCGLSLLNSTETGSARPFWQWMRRNKENEVDVGRVAREMAREVQGAKDIFDSLSLLTSGGLMDRSEHVRIWELSVAVQVGSGLEEKEVVSQQLVHLGNVARDLSESLIETNVMAVDSFTWLQWEFSALVKALKSPPESRPSPTQLATRLNTLLKRLSDSLDKLHESASSAFILAQKGSTTGQTLRSRLNPLVEDLRGKHEREPGWRLAVDKSKHFITGGEISKAERISRDLSITETTIASLSGLVAGLENTRLGIKTFASQIGYFQASMVGFHLGAGEHVGIGPEEEVEFLAQIVGELGKSVGRAKSYNLRETEYDDLAIEA